MPHGKPFYDDDVDDDADDDDDDDDAGAALLGRFSQFLACGVIPPT